MEEIELPQDLNLVLPASVKFHFRFFSVFLRRTIS